MIRGFGAEKPGLLALLFVGRKQTVTGLEVTL